MKIEPFALERWMSGYEMLVECDVSVGGITPLAMNDLLALEPGEQRAQILDGLLSARLGYSEARGSLELRSAIAATYRNCSPENILVTTGAIEANFLLFNVLLNAGDSVVVPDPAYQQLASVPRAIGCNVALWHIRPENGFRYDLQALEQLVTPQTRLIVVNVPHNPTGAILLEEELRQVYALAESVGAQVLCDETYRWLAIEGSNPGAPPAFDLGPDGISVGTLSKTFGLPGLRIGWIAAPEPIIQACWAMRDYISLCPGKLSDALACIAFRHRERIMARNQAIIQQNLQTMQDWLETQNGVFSWTPPRGGLLSMIRYNLDIPSLEFANGLAEEYKVMFVPGIKFGFEHYLRLGLGQHPAIFTEGLKRAGAYVAHLRTSGSVSVRE
jgi:aspartate/methionine/tyrosine aminotransferase